MKPNETEMLLQLRTYTIEAFDSLDGVNEPSSMIKQQDVAATLMTIIKSLEEVIAQSGQVTFN